MSQTKRCAKCSVTKATTEFTVDRKRKDKLNSYCKQCHHEHYMANREREKLRNQKTRIKRRYGLEWGHYLELKAKGCAICGSQEKLHVDHCHSTGVTRGILCNGCNASLGHCGDDPEKLRAIADWIETKPAIAQGLPGPSY